MNVATTETRQYRYYDFVMAAYVCVLLCSNLIGPAKETSVNVPIFGTVTFLAGVLFFPISYIFGDILTEVYGYARDRRVVWAGFGALAFASLMATIVVHLPPSAAGRANQAALVAIFGNTPRIVAASIIAFLCGTFVNSYVLAKMKIWTRGRWLWTRLVGSTLCGELVDSALFYTIAFYGRMSWPHLQGLLFTQY
ncbi:MAG: queuosine precursor transporter, partial [Gammaproteobacteria bacterium]|nr:queuosine precursor transporter [Gammaproteobacteria bacterium]